MGLFDQYKKANSQGGMNNQPWTMDSIQNSMMADQIHRLSPAMQNPYAMNPKANPWGNPKEDSTLLPNPSMGTSANATFPNWPAANAPHFPSPKPFVGRPSGGRPSLFPNSNPYGFPPPLGTKPRFIGR